MDRRWGRGKTPVLHIKKYSDDVLASTIITLALCVFVQTHKYKSTFKYGRYTTQEDSKYKLITVQSPAAWIMMNIPGILIPFWIYYYLEWRPLNETGVALVSMWLLHYTWRALLYPFLIRGGKNIPFSTFTLGWMYCFANSIVQMMHINGYQAQQEFPLMVFGLTVFLFGLAINIFHDILLRGLRKKGEKGYRIPQGGLFEFVSCPNYLGEMIEWTGFALASGFALTPVAHAVFMCCFLGPRALQHHEWYFANFKKYPADRKALIPMLL